MLLGAFDGQVPERVQIFILVCSGHLRPWSVRTRSFYGFLHPLQVRLDDEIACIISISVHLIQGVEDLLGRVGLHALFYRWRGGMEL